MLAASPGWLAGWAPPERYERCGPRVEEFRLPKAAEREELAERIGSDGLRLLEAVEAEDAPAGLRDWARSPRCGVCGPSSTTRRRSRAAPHEAAGTEGDAASGADDAVSLRSGSPLLLKARGELGGYKVHLTETCAPEGPNLLTDVRTTSATTPDLEVLGAVHGALEERNLLPGEHLADSAYMGSKEMVGGLVRHGMDLFGRCPATGAGRPRPEKGSTRRRSAWTGKRRA